MENGVYSSQLCHYGVLGMKWGVRKATRNVRKAHGRKSEEYKNAKEKAKKDLLSKQSKGKRIATNILETAIAETVISNVSVGLMMSGRKGAAYALATAGQALLVANVVKGIKDLRRD